MHTRNKNDELITESVGSQFGAAAAKSIKFHNHKKGGAGPFSGR